MKNKIYESKNPCKHGHGNKRYISNDFCVVCSKIYHDKYKAKNKEKVASMRKSWKVKNKKKHCELNKISRERHLEKSRARSKKYNKDNPLVIRAAKIRRRLKLGGKYFYVSKKFIQELIEKQKNNCASCFQKLTKIHIDHIIPVAKGGDNAVGNLQALCPNCNQRKHAKDPFDWANENGRLL